MQFSQLVKGVPNVVRKGEDVTVARLEIDSRKVEQGTAFCCIPGFQVDGHDFAAQAKENGAVALIVEHEVPVDLPQAIVPDMRTALSAVAANFYGHPADKLRLFAVTGTNGKTTTTFMLKTVLESAGEKSGLIGTVVNLAGNEAIGESLTTPEPLQMQGYFAQMVQKGCGVCCMEASSQAISQHRIEGLHFRVGIFSNLTQDHLDYHKTMACYAAEKKKLFYQCDIGLFNADDPYADEMRRDVPCRSYTYGVDHAADYRAECVQLHAHGVEYDLVAPQGSGHVQLPIPGRFSVYNSLACAAACLAAGLPMETVLNGLHQVKTVPGRIELVPTPGCDFSVILDYAHTPDGLVNILSAVRDFTKGRVIALFGCGGDRDPKKRPLMGLAAGQRADLCIVTSDNPRTEEPASIIQAIIPGVEESGCPYEVVENRREAIGRALRIAQKGDVIVLAGKGHEPYQIIGKTKYPFDEKQIVAEELQAMNSDGKERRPKCNN